jgi:uncharacterized membrane protein
MKLRDTYFTDILLLLVLTAFTMLSIFIPLLSTTYLKAILGILFVSFLPGYALISYLFPKKSTINLSERLLLSFATSVAIVTLLGFILNYTPFGIHLEIMAVIITLFIIFFAILTYIKRNHLDKNEAFSPEFLPKVKNIKKIFGRENKIDKMLSIILIILIVLTISMTTYAIVKPKSSENFTEFFILGSNGMNNYTTSLNSGQNSSLTAVIVNHENEPKSYLMVVNLDGKKIVENDINLDNNQRLDIPITFTAGNPGKSELVLLLYKKPDLLNVYLSLHYWITIS